MQREKMKNLHFRCAIYVACPLFFYMICMKPFERVVWISKHHLSYKGHSPNVGFNIHHDLAAQYNKPASCLGVMWKVTPLTINMANGKSPFWTGEMLLQMVAFPLSCLFRGCMLPDLPVFVARTRQMYGICILRIQLYLILR